MTFFYSLGIAITVIMFIIYLKSKHPIKNALKGMISGVSVLLILYFFGSHINIQLDISHFNTAVSLILGIPGVLALVFAKILL